MTICESNTMDNTRKFSIMPQNVQLPFVLKKIPRKRNRIVRYNEDNRLMSKSGRIHVYLKKIPDKSLHFARDLWNTLVNMRWRWLMVTVFLVNFFAYLLFAGFFYFDAWLSGDFDNDLNYSPANLDQLLNNSQMVEKNLCIKGVQNFTSFFMLGIETITTTGYGYFHPTEYCQLVWFVLTFSTWVTIFIDGAFISVVYAKISRPTYRSSKGLFSKKAIISLRDGKLCLIFRINDRLGNHRINSRIKLFLVKESLTKETDLLPNHLTQLKLEPYGPLFWPIEIVHQINAQSPLWNLSAKQLMTSNFELLVTIVGNSVLTGQATLSQTSYLSKEILWGYWFNSCVDYCPIRNCYLVDDKRFNFTVSLNTPLCSANHLNVIENEIRKKRYSFDCGHLSSEER